MKDTTEINRQDLGRVVRTTHWGDHETNDSKGAVDRQSLGGGRSGPRSWEELQTVFAAEPGEELNDLGTAGILLCSLQNFYLEKN